MKFSAPFLGVPAGEIYPVEYAAGDECPAEFEASAAALGVLEKEEEPAGKPGKSK